MGTYIIIYIIIDYELVIKQELFYYKKPLANNN